MKEPRIAVKAFMANDSEQTILAGETPKNAIEQYFFPDSMKCSVSIHVMNTDGKSLTLYINGENNTVSWKEL